MKKKYNTRNFGNIESQLSLSSKKALPSTGYLKRMNEPVKVTKLPHPFKCSKCNHIATNRADFNEHWSLEH